MLNIESVAPLPSIKPRRRSIAYCISIHEGEKLFDRWSRRFPKLRYMAPVKNNPRTVDVAKPPEMVISESPFDLPHNTAVAGLLIGDRWRPKWREVDYFAGSRRWEISNLPWPSFKLNPPYIEQALYLKTEELNHQNLQVIWDYGNEAGPPFASYLFSTIRRLLKVEEAKEVVIRGEHRGWRMVKEVWRIKTSPGALAWAGAKPRRRSAFGYLPVDADLEELGFGDIPHRP